MQFSDGNVQLLVREVVLLTTDRNLRVKALAQNVPVRELPDFIRWSGLLVWQSECRCAVCSIARSRATVASSTIVGNSPRALRSETATGTKTPTTIGKQITTIAAANVAAPPTTPTGTATDPQAASSTRSRRTRRHYNHHYHHHGRSAAAAKRKGAATAMATAAVQTTSTTQSKRTN